jgi:hypothetical protein
MLDVALRRFLVYAAIVLALLAYIGWRVLEFSVPGARLLAAAAALAPVGFAVYFVGRLDRSLRAYLRTVLTYGRQRIAAVTAGVSTALLLIAVVAPEAWLSWLLGLAAAGGFGARLLTVSASNAHVRSAGVDVPRISTATLVIVAAAVGVIGLASLVAGAAERDAGLLGLSAVLLGLTGLAVAMILRRRRAVSS